MWDWDDDEDGHEFVVQRVAVVEEVVHVLFQNEWCHGDVKLTVSYEGNAAVTYLCSGLFLSRASPVFQTMFAEGMVRDGRLRIPSNGHDEQTIRDALKFVHQGSCPGTLKRLTAMMHPLAWWHVLGPDHVGSHVLMDRVVDLLENDTDDGALLGVLADMPAEAKSMWPPDAMSRIVGRRIPEDDVARLRFTFDMWRALGGTGTAPSTFAHVGVDAMLEWMTTTDDASVADIVTFVEHRLPPVAVYLAIASRGRLRAADVVVGTMTVPDMVALQALQPGVIQPGFDASTLCTATAMATHPHHVTLSVLVSPTGYRKYNTVTHPVLGSVEMTSGTSAIITPLVRRYAWEEAQSMTAFGIVRDRLAIARPLGDGRLSVQFHGENEGPMVVICVLPVSKGVVSVKK